MSLWHPDTYRLLSVTLLASVIQGQAFSVQQELARVKLTELQSLLRETAGVYIFLQGGAIFIWLCLIRKWTIFVFQDHIITLKSLWVTELRKHLIPRASIAFSSALNSTWFLIAQTSPPEYVKFTFSFPFWMAMHGMPLCKHTQGMSTVPLHFLNLLFCSSLILLCLHSLAIDGFSQHHPRRCIEELMK